MEEVAGIRHFICETPKPARRFLKQLPLETDLQDLYFYPLNKRTEPERLPEYLEPCLNGERMALLSDAGCPGIADPGSELVDLAHRYGIPVVPLPGPSSLFLALMGSGLNGQRFRFHGYAPYNDKELKKLLGEMKRDAKGGETQLIMETPYRNERLLDAFLKLDDGDLRLCIAADLNGAEAFIRTLPIHEWQKERPPLHKRPAVFLLGK